MDIHVPQMASPRLTFKSYMSHFWDSVLGGFPILFDNLIKTNEASYTSLKL